MSVYLNRQEGNVMQKVLENDKHVIEVEVSNEIEILAQDTEDWSEHEGTAKLDEIEIKQEKKGWLIYIDISIYWNSGTGKHSENSTLIWKVKPTKSGYVKELDGEEDFTFYESTRSGKDFTPKIIIDEVEVEVN